MNEFQSLVGWFCGFLCHSADALYDVVEIGLAEMFLPDVIAFGIRIDPGPDGALIGEEAASRIDEYCLEQLFDFLEPRE